MKKVEVINYKTLTLPELESVIEKGKKEDKTLTLDPTIYINQKYIGTFNNFQEYADLEIIKYVKSNLHDNKIDPYNYLDKYLDYNQLLEDNINDKTIISIKKNNHVHIFKR